jgi:hypothetical protein
MPEPLRRLNEEGINQFRRYLTDLRNDGTLGIPDHLLRGNETSESVAGSRSVERVGFVTKKQAAEYLLELLASLNLPDIENDVGLWSWLSLFFFDAVCPVVNGKRKAVADPHYILDAANHNRRYRHLLATPFVIIRALPDHNRIFLNAPLPVHGDLIEQTMSRLFLIRIPSVREAIDLLYFDPQTDRAKKGTLNKTPKRGDLRTRFPIRIRQLSMTHDIMAMTGEQLIDALGNEFDAWRTQDAN